MVLDKVPSLALAVANEIGDILKDEEARSVNLENAYSIVDEIAPSRAIKSLLSACLGEWLAREPGTEDVVGGYGRQVKFAYVACGAQPEVLLIKERQRGVDLAGVNAPVAEGGESQVEATKAGEEIKESEWGGHGRSQPVLRVVRNEEQANSSEAREFT